MTFSGAGLGGGGGGAAVRSTSGARLTTAGATSRFIRSGEGASEGAAWNSSIPSTTAAARPGMPQVRIFFVSIMALVRKRVVHRGHVIEIGGPARDGCVLVLGPDHFPRGVEQPPGSRRPRLPIDPVAHDVGR